MTPKKLTVDDVRHHAEEVRDLAVSEVKKITEAQATKVVVIGAIALVAVVSLAYYLGSRNAGGPVEY